MKFDAGRSFDEGKLPLDFDADFLFFISKRGGSANLIRKFLCAG